MHTYFNWFEFYSLDNLELTFLESVNCVCWVAHLDCCLFSLINLKSLFLVLSWSLAKSDQRRPIQQYKLHCWFCLVLLARLLTRFLSVFNYLITIIELVEVFGTKINEWFYTNKIILLIRIFKMLGKGPMIYLPGTPCLDHLLIHLLQLH